jgi:hypothetical protein
MNYKGEVPEKRGIGKSVCPGLQTDPTPNAGSIQTEGNRASRLELAELTALHRRP